MKYILKYFLLNLIQLWLPHPKFRAIYLRRLGAQIGKNVRVERVKFIQIQHSISNLILKDYAFIGTDVIIDLSDKTIIGERSIVAPRCTLLTHQDFGYFNGNGISKIIPKKFAPLIMEEDVVISADRSDDKRYTQDHPALL